MEYVIKNREPKLPLQYFEEISAIPRGSHNEAAVAAYVAQRAKELGLYVRVDECNNVVVKKPGSKGCENQPALLMQAHLDMVCEKNQDTVHDFTKDGIELIVEGNVLRANGTTLGADNGGGVAYMLALMDADSDAFPHPPLEFLFTTAEEVGFDGALGLDCSDITARRMFGLDCGSEGVLCISSAGTQEIDLKIPYEYESRVGSWLNACLKIKVRGLKGGHSGGCITMELGNANKIMGRVLHHLKELMDVALIEIKGGLMFNAIPREADALIAINSGCLQLAQDEVAKLNEIIKNELAFSDAGVTIKAEVAAIAGSTEKGKYEKVMSLNASQTIIDTLYLAPNGVYMMNMAIPGLPVTSSNMGVVSMQEDGVNINFMMRSSSRSVKEDQKKKITEIAKLCGVKQIVYSDWMPEWDYNPDSPIRETTKALYKELTGEEMVEHGGHGGLELGVFCDKMPGMDIVTLGCKGGGAHTVTEWLDMDSYGRVYDFMKKLIVRLTEE